MQNLFYPLLLLLLIIPACVVQKGHLSAETDGKQALSLNPAAPPFSSIVWWRFKRLWNGNIRQEANQVREAELQPHPVHLRTLGSGQVELTWLGHSSTLLRVDGVTILTDPVLGDSASPVSWAGPERVVPPALTVRSLPFIDYVVISHNHYDHLDLHTLRQIAELSRSDGRQTLFLVPEGLQGWLKENGIIHTVELIWWKTYTKDNWRFTAVPVQHHSGRGVFDHNRSKWAGWAIEKNDFRFFFVGDSGYFSGFKEIGERLGPFTLAAIPIGGYAPRKLMQYAHMNPEEAIAVHKDIRAKKSVGIHWGTFLGLTDEPFFEPRHRLSTEVARAGLEKTEFSAIDIGQSITITDR